MFRFNLAQTRADRQVVTLTPLQMSYPDSMDYVEVLQEKIRRLRVEIAEIQRLNERYQRQDENEAVAEAHRKRHERLQAIQQELAQLAAFGRKGPSGEENTEKDCFLHPIKKAS